MIFLALNFKEGIGIGIEGVFAAHSSGRNMKSLSQCLPYYQWIGLRENLQETIDFPIKYGVFL